MDQPRIDIIKFSLLILEQILISFMTILTLLVVFFFIKISIIYISPTSDIGAFCIFLLQKDFATFHESFF